MQQVRCAIVDEVGDTRAFIDLFLSRSYLIHLDFETFISLVYWTNDPHTLSEKPATTRWQYSAKTNR